MKTILCLTGLLICISQAIQAQWNYEYISQARVQLGTAKLGNDIFFIGGYDGIATTNVVDAYNTATQTWWPTTAFSTSRTYAACTAGDSALYIAGGIENFTQPLKSCNLVDIYKNGVWYTDTLSDSIFYAQAIHAGSKIIIAGAALRVDPNTNLPVLTDNVYIFDELTGQWTTEHLSIARTGIAVATDGVHVLFAGGITSINVTSNVVDIYNIQTNNWTTDTLSVSRSNVAGAYSNGKFYFAGGARTGINNSSDVVDIYDGNSWTVAHLSTARAGIQAGAAGNFVFFAGGGDIDNMATSFTSSSPVTDIADAVNGTWTSINMTAARINHTAIGAGNKFYVAGGLDMNNSQLLDMVEIYDITTGVVIQDKQNFTLYPNPATTEIHLPFLNLNEASVQIFKSTGEKIADILQPSPDIDISMLKPGLYIIRLEFSNFYHTIKFIKE